MKWEKVYQQKLVGAEEAISHIKSGDRVVAGHAAGTPELLLKTMVDHKDQFQNVEIAHQIAMGHSLYCRPECQSHFIHNSLFAGAGSRQAINEGRAVFTAVHNSDLPSLFIDRILPADVTLCMLSVPDQQGYCSFGVSVDYTKPAAESSRLVIAEVTPNMRRKAEDGSKE